MHAGGGGGACMDMVEVVGELWSKWFVVHGDGGGGAGGGDGGGGDGWGPAGMWNVFGRWA